MGVVFRELSAYSKGLIDKLLVQRREPVPGDPEPSRMLRPQDGATPAARTDPIRLGFRHRTR
jgi:hypothetical protein